MLRISTSHPTSYMQHATYNQYQQYRQYQYASTLKRTGPHRNGSTIWGKPDSEPVRASATPGGSRQVRFLHNHWLDCDRSNGSRRVLSRSFGVRNGAADRAFRFCAFCASCVVSCIKGVRTGHTACCDGPKSRGLTESRFGLECRASSARAAYPMNTAISG